MSFRLSAHALLECGRRKISLDLVERVLYNPEQILPQELDLRVYQSRFTAESGRMYLLRVFVSDKDDESVVVTVYRTSKVRKYWSEP